MKHPQVRVVSFTGTTRVGQSLVQLSAGRLQRLALELGGNAPFLVYGDANVERAIEAALLAKFRNNGQSCIAANRFYVQAAVYDEFVEGFTARVKQMHIGNPLGSPMGGFRMSGLGREGGRIGLEEFQEVKYVSGLV